MSALTDTYQLEFWAPKGRKGGAWVAASPADTGAPNGRFRSWRRVKPGHTHKDKLAHSIAAVRPCGYASGGKESTRTDRCDQYVRWALYAGLRAVHVFRNDHISTAAAKIAGLEPVPVELADFIGPLTVEEVLP